MEALRASGPTVIGFAFLILMACAWLFPGDSGLLEFTEPEIQFLFVAPVTRRQLLVHRMMRSQVGLLVAAIVPALFFPSGFSGFFRLRLALAMWIILMTMKVHFTGISLARASLSMEGAGARRCQWGPLVVMLGAIAIVGAAVAADHVDARGADGLCRSVRSAWRGRGHRRGTRGLVAVHGAGVAVVRGVARTVS